MPKDKTFLKRQGAVFLALINDLKRNRQAAARELDVPQELIEKIIAGEADFSMDLLRRATEIWPVNLRDFMIIEDDTREGILPMAREASEKSSRVFARGGSAYYEYRDTAMSKLAPFRPEWILELVAVGNNDPENKSLQWNNGHFMHQFTMFVNAVNFYYVEGNQKKVMTADTGDSMYITPFVPHTFATRREDSEKKYGGRPGLILALTYGNKLQGDVQHEMSALGGHLSRQYLLETESREAYFASLLKLQMEALSHSAESLSAVSGLAVPRLESFVSAKTMPGPEELGRLAECLQVNSCDLMPPDVFDPAVKLSYLKDAVPRRFQNYRIRELAGVRYLPYSKGLLIDVLEPANGSYLKVPLHQYIYNVGDSPVIFEWRWEETVRQMELCGGDSLYVKPHVPHSFSPKEGDRGSVLSLRIGGKGAGEPQRELAHIGGKNMKRIYQEYSLWYKEE